MKYKIYKSGTQWRWKFVADNNEIVASGESYHNLSDCKHAVKLLQSSLAAAVEVVDGSTKVTPKMVAEAFEKVMSKKCKN